MKTKQSKTKTASATRVREYAQDPMAFFGGLSIPVGTGKARFRDVWVDFQVEMFQVISPCLKAVASGRKPPYRGFWLERTKGGSKDSDVGLCLLWLLLFSPRPLLMEAGADDQDQAMETYKAMQDVARLNDWIGQRLTFQKGKIFCRATASCLEFLTTDTHGEAGGTHGSRPALTVCNELSHVGSKAFVQTMLDNARKLPQNLIIICTNAGNRNTWQWEWREKYHRNPRWWFQKLEKPAPWIASEDIEDAKISNTTARLNRLWFGRWALEGDALDAADVEACITLERPRDIWPAGWFFASGLDLGVKNDHSGLIVLGCEPATGRIELADCKSWAPGAGGQVDLREVKRAHLEAYQQFNLCWCGFDPNQAFLMAQELAGEGLPMREISFASGNNLNIMARDLIQAFKGRRLHLYPEADLIDDLFRLNLVERRYGYKLEAVSDQRGHADRAIALAIVLPYMIRLSANPAGLVEDDYTEYRAVT